MLYVRPSVTHTLTKGNKLTTSRSIVRLCTAKRPTDPGAGPASSRWTGTKSLRCRCRAVRRPALHAPNDRIDDPDRRRPLHVHAPPRCMLPPALSPTPFDAEPMPRTAATRARAPPPPATSSRRLGVIKRPARPRLPPLSQNQPTSALLACLSVR